MLDISLEEAVELLLGRVAGPILSETVPLYDALGRAASRDVAAATDQPPFDRSPLDGYAFRHQDSTGASRENPVTLKVVGTTFAGDAPARPLQAGEAVRLMTGSPIPEGATCVIRQEDTDQGEKNVKLYRAHTEHENYCFAGEDLRQGEILVRAGEVLTHAHLGVLGGQGIAELAVFARPRVGILSTGSELAAPGQKLKPGQIYDSNRPMLAARTLTLGAVPVEGASTADDPQALADVLKELLKTCDMAVTTGGVSVGAKDYMPAVGELMGAELIFHGVMMKPGGHVMALDAGGKVVVCLSGNPFAAAANFELLARPALRKLAGYAQPRLDRWRAVLHDDFPKRSPGRRFLRARLEAGDVYLPAQNHESGKLGSLVGCNCLVDIPAGSAPLGAGTPVDVIPF